MTSPKVNKEGHTDDCDEVMKKEGPGQWVCIHIICLNANTYSDVNSAIYNIRSITIKIRCLRCRKHTAQYLKMSPPEANRDKLFSWSVGFHNQVSERLGKPTWSVIKAKKYYDNPPVISDLGCVLNKK